MSWLVDVAGRAEELLNRVDKSAAVALQQKELKEKQQAYHPGLSSLAKHASEEFTNPTKAMNETSSQSAPFTPKTSSDTNVSSNSGVIPKMVKTAIPRSKSKSPVSVSSSNNEESLFEFLNAPDAIHSSQKNSSKDLKNTMSPPRDKVLSAELSTSHVESSPEITADENSKSLLAPSSPMATESHKENSEKLINKLEDKKNQSQQPKETLKPTSLLAAEVRELKAREVDYAAALEAKDSQLAILRVRLQEADQDLKSTSQLLKNYKEDNERLLKEHTSVSEVNYDAISKLKLKLEETELALEQEKEGREKATAEARLNYSKFEEEKQQHAINLASTQKSITELKGQVKDLSQQLRQSKSGLETVKQDLAYYRQKAQRLLQSKEKLISTLKDNNLSNDDQIEGSDGNQRLALEESLVKENDCLREDLMQSKATSETLRSELQNLEQSFQEEIERNNEKIRNLEDSFQVEKQCREDVENEILQHKEEIKYLREDLTRTKTNLHSRIKDRDLEVEKLRKQLTTKLSSGSNQGELESRIRNLTESLIQKQTVLEALSTEKNSLVMQLERLEQRMKDIQLTNNKGNLSVGIPVEDSKHRFQGVYFSENAFDGSVTKNVKKAYGIIDSLSIRTGSFLRRNPASRAFLLAYMFLLHIWVLIILLSYQPEIHGKGPEIPL